MNTSASASTFSCPWRSPKPPSLLCGATFQSRGDLLLHGPRHSTERSYYCAPCSLHNKKPKLIHRNFSRLNLWKKNPSALNGSIILILIYTEKLWGSTKRRENPPETRSFIRWKFSSISSLHRNRRFFRCRSI
jgi:hypothetical protein